MTANQHTCKASRFHNIVISAWQERIANIASITQKSTMMTVAAHARSTGVPIYAQIVARFGVRARMKLEVHDVNKTLLIYHVYSSANLPSPNPGTMVPEWLFPRRIVLGLYHRAGRAWDMSKDLFFNIMSRDGHWADKGAVGIQTNDCVDRGSLTKTTICPGPVMFVISFNLSNLVRK